MNESYARPEIDADVVGRFLALLMADEDYISSQRFQRAACAISIVPEKYNRAILTDWAAEAMGCQKSKLIDEIAIYSEYRKEWAESDG